MKNMTKALVVAGVLALSPVVYANEIDATDPKKIASLVSEWATDVEIGTDSDGDPQITFKYDDLKQSVYFYGCTQGKKCKSIQFSLAYTNDGSQTLRTINNWNSSKRFGKAYLDDDNDPILRMDVELEVKVSKAYLRDVMVRWQSVSSEFADFVD